MIFVNKANNTSQQAGHTILESIVALFIFGCVSTAIFTGIGAADKIHSRGFVAMNASRIAENTFENLRRKVMLSQTIDDSSWTENVDNRIFEIERRKILPDSLRFNNIEPSLVDIELSIKSNKHSFKFRMLQGYSW